MSKTDAGGPTLGWGTADISMLLSWEIRMKATLMAGLAVLLMAGLTSASTIVTLTGTLDHSTWYVYAKVTGDNDGLSFVDIQLAGINELGATINTVVQDDYVGPTLVGTYGFNQEKGTPFAFDTHSVEMILGMNPALEGTADAKYNLRQLGREAVSFTYTDELGNMVPVTTAFDPALGMLIASGARLPDGTVPSFTAHQYANVWVTGQSEIQQVTVVEASQPVTRQFLPEPATLALMGAGGLLATLMRRRRS
jgi:hypothetical protein